MTAIVLGIVFVGLGAAGLFRWFGDFIVIVRGFLPLSLLIGGIVALVAGVSALQGHRDHGSDKS